MCTVRVRHERICKHLQRLLTGGEEAIVEHQPLRAEGEVRNEAAAEMAWSGLLDTMANLLSRVRLTSAGSTR